MKSSDSLLARESDLQRAVQQAERTYNGAVELQRRILREIAGGVQPIKGLRHFDEVLTGRRQAFHGYRNALQALQEFLEANRAHRSPGKKRKAQVMAVVKNIGFQAGS